MKLTVDIVVFKEESVLLIERKYDPCKGQNALPGGHVEEDELVIDAAKRELKEETRIDADNMQFVGYYDGINRDPRGRTISIAFMTETTQEPKAGDDAKEAFFLPIAEATNLAFDHDLILKDALAKRL